MMRRARRSIARLSTGQNGQMVVEFALLVPVMVLLLMGVLDFSVAVSRATQLTAAVQEGSSAARLSPNSTANIRDHVKKEGLGLNLADADITITCYTGLSTTTTLCSSAVFGDTVKVQATHRYTPITGRLIQLAGSPISITQSATSEIY